MGLLQQPYRIVVALMALGWAVLPASAATFTVTSSDDAGSGTLREALTLANQSEGPHTIGFALTGTAPFSITLESALPALVQAITIDGTTQTEYSSQPVIELDNGGAVTTGLEVGTGGDDTTLRGLSIVGFVFYGIDLNGPANVAVEQCYLGLRANGDLQANGTGIRVNGTHETRIGGSTMAQGNVISGNTMNGLEVLGACTDLQVSGNLIGTDPDGLVAVANGTGGILHSGGTVTTIGGLVGNVISGNGGYGVKITGTGDVLLTKNLIGLDINGTAGIPNAANGVWVDGSGADASIGSGAVNRNIISGNNASGVLLSGCDSNVDVASNYIGLDINGTSAISNGLAGLEVSASNQLDFSNNVISGNGTHGILIQNSASISLQDNQIGTNAAGTAALGNLQNGVQITNGTGSGTTVGYGGHGNLISGNTGYGISLTSTPNVYLLGNKIGTNLAGDSALANGSGGILISGGSGTHLGGADLGEGNLISGNSGHGVAFSLAGSGNEMYGNTVGRNLADSASLPNTGTGVLVASTAQLKIGDLDDGDGPARPYGENVISGNLVGGVRITESSSVAVRGNAIYGNTGLQVDLGGDGPTLNDLDDSDTGPNGLLNFPALLGVDLVESGTELVFKGYCRPGMTIDLYVSDGLDTYGQPTSFLASLQEGAFDDLDSRTGTYTTPFRGIDHGSEQGARFEFRIPNSLELGAGNLVTAIGYLGGVTSECSGVCPIAGNPVSLQWSVSPQDAAVGALLTPAPRVAVVDSSNHEVVSAALDVAVALDTNPTDTTLQGTTTVATVDGGAVFSDLSIDDAAEGYTLRASATGYSNVISSPFDITPGTPAGVAFLAQPTSAIAGIPFAPAVKVEVVDEGGHRVSDSTAPITLALEANPGSATLAGTLTVNAVAGVATFTGLTITTAASGYTLKATSTGLNSQVSSAFDVLASLSEELRFVQQPTETTAGQTFSPALSVELVDRYGNRLLNANDPVTIALDPGSPAATLEGTLTQSMSGGLVAFPDLVLTEANTGYRLLATVGGANPATSDAFTIRPGTPSVLRFVQQPSNTDLGQAITPAPSVEVLDGFDNRVTDTPLDLDVTFAKGGIGATFTGTSPVTTINGVATFTDLKLDSVGEGYTLSVTGSGLSQVTSGEFDVRPAPPVKLRFVDQPGNGTVNTALDPAVKVELLDAQDQRVTEIIKPVTIAIASNPGEATLGGTLTVATLMGVASFDNLTLDWASTGYTLEVTATGLTAATSTAFDIAPAPAPDAPPVALRFVQQPQNAAAGAALSPAPSVELLDAQGDRVVTATNAVTVAFGANPGSATLGGTRTVAAVAGVATFADLTVDAAGTGYTLQATATGLTAAASASFDVTDAAPPVSAVGLRFVQQPQNTTAGTALSPVPSVELLDAQGDRVTSATNAVTVAFGTNPAGGTLGGTRTVAAVAGLATFTDLWVDTAGDGYTLQATAAGLSDVATSAAFNVAEATEPIPVPVALRIVQQPQIAAAGAVLSPAPTVELLDAQGDRVTIATNPVTMAFGTNPAGGTLGGTLTVAAVAGVATFADLSVDTIGAGYTLQATAAGLTAATSAAFDIVAGAPAALRFVQQPGNGAAGAALNPAPAVELLDARGNRATAATNAVTVAFDANPASGTLGGTLTVAAVAGVATFADLSVDTIGDGYTLQATASGLTSATSAAFDIGAGAPAAGSSSLLASPTSLRADGVSPVGVTLTLRDAWGNLVAGVAPARLAVVADPAEGVTITGPTQATDGAGQATATVVSVRPGLVNLTATLDGAVLGSPVAITWRPRAVDVGQSTVSVVPAVVPADGTTVALITVVLRDATGAPVAGSHGADRSVVVSRDGAVTDQLTVADDGTAADATGAFTLQATASAAGTYAVAVTVDGVALAPIEVTGRLYYDLARAAGLHLVSVPFDADPASLAGLLGETGVRSAQWQAAGQQYGPMAAAAGLAAGQGFWLNLASDLSYRLSGQPLPDGPVTLALEPGWNLIGNPFDAPLPWDLSALQVVSGGVTQPLGTENLWATTLAPYAWQWDSASQQYALTFERSRPGFDSVRDALPVGSAAFVLAAQPCSLILSPPVAGRATRAVAEVTARSWHIGLTASSEAGQSRITVGQTEPLSRALAIARPPAVVAGSGVELTVTAADGRALAGEMRPAGAGEQRWVLTAESHDGRAVTLNWAGLLRQLPRGLLVELVDQQTGQTTLLNTKSSYQYTPGRAGESRRFELRTRYGNLTRTTITSLSAAPTRGGGVELSVVLSGEARVTLIVRGLGGRLVRQISQTASGEGPTRVVWDGTDTEGRRVPGGTYVLEAVAESANGAVNRAVRTVTLR